MNRYIKLYKIFAAAAALLYFGHSAAADVFFSGFAGAKADVTSDSTADSFDPQLMVQSFFAGQFSISDSTIIHTEFSLKTSDLIENSIFEKTPAEFRIDELSIIFRKQFPEATNYLSFFVGTYDPIGSDIFLRRQFGIQPISSKLTESWLGLAGSVIYPLFGVGGANIVHFMSQPVAAGVYVYVNHEIDDSYVFNADARFACVYRFFTFDISGGIGTPLQTNSNSDAFFVVNKIYWRAGMNLLLGNSYTSSLFIQAGISDVPFTKKDGAFEPDADKTYMLIEPRFRTPKFQLNLTAFSLPKETVSDFIFINDTLGFNMLVYTDQLYIKNKTFTFGINGAWTFPEKDFKDLKNPLNLIKEDFNITLAPYFATRMYNGQFNMMLQVKVSELTSSAWYSAFKLNIGYKTQF